MLRNITETIKNVSYAGTTRIAVVEQTINRADDYAHVGDLYFRMSDIYRRLDTEISDNEKTALNTDLENIKNELSVYLDYLAGYEA